MKRILSFLVCATLCLSTTAQLSYERDTLHSYFPTTYRVEMQSSFSDGRTPLWLTANRYGLSSVRNTSGYLRASVFRPVTTDSLYQWRIGYGVDLAVAHRNTSTLIAQQLYADFEYRRLRLTIGAKEEPLQLKNALLSSGGQTLGINARPIPSIRLSVPEYLSLTGESDWLAIKGHIAFGRMTDGNFLEESGQRSGANYGKDVLYHSKAGYLRIGNKKLFPLVFEGGLEMACQFGGTIYNGSGRVEGLMSHPVKMPSGIGAYWDAIIGTGSDPTDAGYAGASGNTLGSWLFSLAYYGPDWKVRAYYDHFFEDHSMMFFQYGWLDGLVGVELTLPDNPYISGLVYEYMTTTYQSGPIYHDPTAAIPDGISAADNYYNHALYSGWQHWGQAIGNPLFTSPLYRADGVMKFVGNRFRAHHIGWNGQPLRGLSYRVLYTYMENWGTYAHPYDERVRSHNFLLDIAYRHDDGWGADLGFGMDRGHQVGNNTGVQFTLSKTF